MNWQALRDLAGRGYAPNALLDVGAHLGAFSKSFVEVFPNCVPVLIEPNPHCSAALSSVGFECHAFAASDENGEAELHLTKEWLQSTGASLYRENTHFFRDEVLTKVRVPKRRLDDVFGDRRFDVVKIDTQGAELDVLRGGSALVSKADFVLIEVSLVDYNANGARAEEVFAEIESLGFDCAGVLEFHRLRGIANGGLLQMDFLFENRARKSRLGPSDFPGLIDRLQGDGRSGLARSLLQHAAGLIPPDPYALQVLVRQEWARGDYGSALELLLRLRDVAQERADFLPMLQSIIGPAAEKINALMNGAKWAEAKAVAVPFAKLLPGFAAAQRAAMVVCANLSDADEAGAFARNLLIIDPHDRQAAQLVERAKIVAGAKPLEIEPARQALFPPPRRHPLVTLRDLHDAATPLLCGELEDGDLPRVRAYIEGARTLTIAVPEGTELEGWVKHYRLALKAMDPTGFIDPAPQLEPAPPQEFATSTGEKVHSGECLNQISAQKAEAIFFVAADAKYVGLYARHFIDSVVRNCDVPFSVIVHVIGGAGRLPEIAASIGRNDVRLFFTGDSFDASGVSTKCYDTPPKGLIPHPAAHYQSVRFQQVGWLLRALGRPIFVSDIDLLLQRGVSDLLARVGDDDVVLNENDHSMNAGSRLTANLVLFNPTSNAEFFSNAIKTYLDRQLAEPEVSRWIDQFGLLMARHRLRRERPAAKIGYFDTNSDINNLMYRSFEKNPFRFLSLYHGFDMTSLEKAA